jgi:hypothetical protein
VAIRLDAVEVSVVEASGVFKAEAEQAIEADVADPDGGERKQDGFGSEEANRYERRWSEIGVGEVVAGSSDANADEIPEHEEVGDEKEESEKQPTGVEVAVEENGPKKNDCAFRLKKELGSGHIRSVTRGWPPCAATTTTLEGHSIPDAVGFIVVVAR